MMTRCEVCGPTEEPVTLFGEVALCNTCLEGVYQDAAAELAAEDELMAMAVLAESLTLTEARALSKEIRLHATIN